MDPSNLTGDAIRACTAHVLVRDDVNAAVLAAVFGYAVTQRSGAVHLRAQLEAPREVYAPLVQLRSLHVTLISLAMNLPESYLPQ